MSNNSVKVYMPQDNASLVSTNESYLKDIKIITLHLFMFTNDLKYPTGKKMKMF